MIVIIQISTLPILSSNNDDNRQTNEDDECAARQIVRHVCGAFKRYLESHLYSKIEQMRRSQMRTNERMASTQNLQPYKVFKIKIYPSFMPDTSLKTDFKDTNL